MGVKNVWDTVRCQGSLSSLRCWAPGGEQVPPGTWAPLPLHPVLEGQAVKSVDPQKLNGNARSTSPSLPGLRGHLSGGNRKLSLPHELHKCLPWRARWRWLRSWSWTSTSRWRNSVLQTQDWWSPSSPWVSLPLPSWRTSFRPPKTTWLFPLRHSRRSLQRRSWRRGRAGR